MCRNTSDRLYRVWDYYSPSKFKFVENRPLYRYDDCMQLPTPQELKRSLPLTPLLQKRIETMRTHTRALISGEDKRLGLVIGPCSIHHLPSALEYGKKVKALAAQVEESCLVIMRVYIEKPRTRVGWKGLLYDPLLDGTNDLAQGIFETRKLLLELAELGVPTATEFVSPLAHIYFQDLIAWGFIGARTSASQPHRELASSLDCPVGFKNPTDGDLDTAVNGVLSAQCAHTFLSINERGQIEKKKSQGNPFAHVVLRGAKEGPNYHQTQEVCDKLAALGLRVKLMIDCAHDNCLGSYLNQKKVFREVIEKILEGEEGILGIMLESHLLAGNASSLTDPCISWEMTEKLILDAHEQLNKISSVHPSRAAEAKSLLPEQEAILL